MERPYGGKATQVAKHSETSLFASNRSPSNSEESGVMERQCKGKATQVAKQKKLKKRGFSHFQNKGGFPFDQTKESVCQTKASID